MCWLTHSNTSLVTFETCSWVNMSENYPPLQTFSTCPSVFVTFGPRFLGFVVLSGLAALIFCILFGVFAAHFHWRHWSVRVFMCVCFKAISVLFSDVSLCAEGCVCRALARFTRGAYSDHERYSHVDSGIYSHVESDRMGSFKCM